MKQNKKLSICNASSGYEQAFFNLSERQPSLLQDQIMEGLKNPTCRLFVTPEQRQSERFEPVGNDSIGFLALITRGSICK